MAIGGWSLEIQPAENGGRKSRLPDGRRLRLSPGLIETDDLSASEAVESGHQPKIEHVFKAQDKHWTSKIHKKYWLRTRYGLVQAAI